MGKRLEVAARKRARVQELIEAGEQPKAIMKTIVNEFGSGISGSEVYARYHEHHGTTPHLTRGKYPRKKHKVKKAPQKKAPPATRQLARIQPLEVTVSATSASPAVDTLLSALLRAMRTEGVDSVMIRADGRATVYHVVSREVQIG